jgi:DNA polymerase III subunit chi
MDPRVKHEDDGKNRMMVLFYQLSSDKSADALTWRCEKIQHYYDQGKRVLIYADDPRMAAKIDALLWSFHPSAFIPHSLENEATDNTPVVIGTQSAPGNFDITFNFSANIPANTPAHNTIVDSVFQSESSKNHGRTRYGAYQKSGAQVKYEKL